MLCSYQCTDLIHILIRFTPKCCDIFNALQIILIFYCTVQLFIADVHKNRVCLIPSNPAKLISSTSFLVK